MQAGRGGKVPHFKGPHRQHRINLVRPMLGERAFGRLPAGGTAAGRSGSGWIEWHTLIDVCGEFCPSDHNAISRKSTLQRIQLLSQRLAGRRAALLAHPIYQQIDRLEALQLFMSHHIFAVWDFMSLLKALQRSYCCIEVPWLPAADATGCRMVNEIVLAEESDEDGRGGYASHFELYHRAMTRVGASTAAIDGLLDALRAGETVEAALASAAVPECARRFVQHTFAILAGGDRCAIAAAFTFGREDLLPDVFQRIVDELNVETAGGLEEFKYYLERHIGLDGDEHGPMAHRLLEALCGDDEARWQLAEQTAMDCLDARQALWDGILAAIAREKSQAIGTVDL